MRLGVNRGSQTTSNVSFFACDSADTGHREKVAVDDVQKVARREAIGGRDDVGLAPANELLADVDRDRTACEGRAQASNGDPRTFGAAIAQVDAPCSST
jgi:hypothetical protein